MSHIGFSKIKALRDAELQASLEKDGYVIVSFLTETECEELKQFYLKIETGSTFGFHSSLMDPDLGRRVAIREKVKAVFERARQHYFTDEYYSFFNCYTIKEPHEESKCVVHQDWAFVDEDFGESVGVWCPTMSVNSYNGCLSILPGSHRYKKTYRGTNVPFEYQSVVDKIEQVSTSLHLHAGQAVIYYSSTIHFSAPNLSSKKRITANAKMVPKALALRHSVYENNTLNTYDISPDFMMQYTFDPSMMKTLGQLVSSENFTPYEVGIKEFKSFYEHYSNII